MVCLMISLQVDTHLLNVNGRGNLIGEEVGGIDHDHTNGRGEPNPSVGRLATGRLLVGALGKLHRFRALKPIALDLVGFPVREVIQRSCVPREISREWNPTQKEP